MSLSPDNHRGCDCEACKKIVKNQTSEIEARLFRPDILVHRRGTDKKNLIAIEVKKEKECFFDQEKLKALTASDGVYRYGLGVFIYFQKGVPLCKFFQNGTENDLFIKCV